MDPKFPPGRNLRLPSYVLWLRDGVDIAVFGLLIPALVFFGGSNHLVNWGPGITLAGAACLLLAGRGKQLVQGGWLHTCALLLFLALLYLRSRYSIDGTAAANNAALMAMAAAGFLIGRLADGLKSRALFIGLSAVALVNLVCTLMQIDDPGWNLVYPDRSAGFPSGLFAHYSYSAAYCLGAAGLLASRACVESRWVGYIMTSGAICSLATIPFSPSRGGNLALAMMAAGAGALLLARAFSKSRPVLGLWLPAAVLMFLAMTFAAAFVPLIDRATGQYGFYHDGVRLGYWNAALRLAGNHPWIGGGAGGFASGVYQELSGLTSEPALVHNEALQLAVDYGYPALAALAALMLIPAGLGLWRFINRSDPAMSALAALGLLAMMFQSNFENIFHCAPGAFVAAMAIGLLNRSLWGAKADGLQKDVPRADAEFLSGVVELADSHAMGDANAAPKLVTVLTGAEDEQWRRGAYRLAYWIKAGNAEALTTAIAKLGSNAAEEMSLGAETGNRPQAIESSRASNITAILFVAAFSVAMMYSGARLSQALAGVWVPLYQPERTTIADRFGRFILLAEKHPGLGIDRDILSAGWDCLHHYRSQEAREKWSSIYQPRLRRALPGWRTDPGATLLLAEITGWAGDYRGALDLYDLAIATQGGNETLFMAHAFKGQYFHELFVSAGASGDEDRQHLFATRAVESFHKSAEAMGGTQRLPKAFADMLKACESHLKARSPQ